MLKREGHGASQLLQHRLRATELLPIPCWGWETGTPGLSRLLTLTLPKAHGSPHVGAAGEHPGVQLGWWD